MTRRIAAEDPRGSQVVYYRTNIRRGMEPTATYLYCVVKAAARPRLGRAPSGMPGGSPLYLAAAGPSLWLIVADVPLARYGAGALEASMRDMQWVGDMALAHEAAIEHFVRAASSTVIPMKLFTIFTSLDRAVAEIRARRAALRSVAGRIAGCDEWGVRVSRVPAAVGRAQAPTVRATSGAAFLAAKKSARDAALAAAAQASEASELAFATLSSIARDVRRRDGAPDGAVNPPLLDAAFLIPRARRAAFRAAVRSRVAACAHAGARLTLTGPWPAYNFIDAGAGR